MDSRTVARPLWNPGGIWRLARLAWNSTAEAWQRRRGDAATTDLAPAEVSVTESASQTEFVKRILAELEEEWQTLDRPGGPVGAATSRRGLTIKSAESVPVCHPVGL
jgi:hypothetical protein